MASPTPGYPENHSSGEGKSGHHPGIQQEPILHKVPRGAEGERSNEGSILICYWLLDLILRRRSHGNLNKGESRPPSVNPSARFSCMDGPRLARKKFSGLGTRFGAVMYSAC
jgi:hypothetical protein